MAELSNKVTMFVPCKVCGRKFKIRVFPNDLTRYNNGELAQNAFPYLSADERELLISGTCPDCWDEMFGDFND